MGRAELNALLWLSLLFLLFGFNDVVFKLREELYGALDKGAFTTILFGTALLLSALGTIRRKEAITVEIASVGLFLGVVNYFSAFWIIRALQVLPGFQVYPINSIGIIVIATLSSAFIWRERPRGHHYLFYVGASGAILLLS